eukprot:4116152-Pyramimonas_sp.AAC.1
MIELRCPTVAAPAERGAPGRTFPTVRPAGFAHAQLSMQRPRNTVQTTQDSSSPPSPRQVLRQRRQAPDGRTSKTRVSEGSRGALSQNRGNAVSLGRNSDMQIEQGSSWALRGSAVM